MSNRHLRTSFAAALMALSTLVGCASQPAVPRDRTDVPGYRNPPPGLTGLDTAPFRDRQILIDPGHGGYFRGAVGQSGLTEAEVNLGVALYLQGMLQWAGAEVRLTRSADVDFLSLADSSLTSDLAARVAICDSLQPDVFLSIHHNSTASRDPDINETQTYYPLGREGADLDLARAIHRQLVRALEIEPAKILPGGFYVLRHSPVPAVLGEPAMISNPVIEGRLTLARSLELEASAYFLGLREYFAAGMPRWVTDVPDTMTMKTLTVPASWRFDSGAPAAPKLDPASLRVTADGEPVAYQLSPDGQSINLDWRTLSGRRELVIKGRNLAGRAAPDRVHVLVIWPGPWRIKFIAEPGPPPYRGLLTYTNESAPLSSFEPLRLWHSDRHRDVIPLPVYPGRRGWLFLESAPTDLTEYELVEQNLSDVSTVWPASGPTILVLPSGAAWIHLATPPEIWPNDPVPGGHWRSRTRWDRSLVGYGDPNWPAVPRRQDTPLWLEADGARPLFLDTTGHTPWQDPGESPPDTLVWQPLLPALIGKRVAIDPRGGGVDDQGLGPLGIRGSDLNLQVAGRLAALLRGAGCQVALVREGEIWTPDPERVRRADQFGADFYLAIGRGAPEVRHHHGSTFGTPWAASCAGAIAPLIADTVVTTPAYDYVLRHTACPAVLVQLEAPTTADIEARLTDAARQNAMARAIFRGTVTLLEPTVEFALFPDILQRLGDRALPTDRLDLARLDGNFVWLPPPGQPAAAAVPSLVAADPGLPLLEGHHVLELRAGPHWQLWTVSRRPGGDWDGRILLENR